MLPARQRLRKAVLLLLLLLWAFVGHGQQFVWCCEAWRRQGLLHPVILRGQGFGLGLLFLLRVGHSGGCRNSCSPQLGSL